VTGPSPRRARTPGRPLYRIGRPPDPLDWPPHAVIGQERFDDPLRQYRVLYAAAQRAGCFAETLAAFRPSLASLAAERAVLNTDEPLRTATIPAEWWRNRLVATFRLAPGRWLDLRTLTTFQVLREEFAELASSLGLADVDLSAATGRVAIAGQERQLTQAISRWAFEHDYHGIVYASRLHHRFACWAVFESATIQPLGAPAPITPADRDFMRIARAFGLTVESQRPDSKAGNHAPS
jgi:RES domain-containing protein